jgi:hypothetical protein
VSGRILAWAPGLLGRLVVLPLVAVSTDECVEALVRAGFAVTSRRDGSAALQKERRTVRVPDGGILPPEALTEILRASGIAYSDFLDLLSDCPTEPALPQARVMRFG